MSNTVKITLRILLLILPWFIILYFLTYATENANIQHSKSTLEQTQGYTYYYNGQEIDKNTIDLSMYRYTVDDEKRTVYITDQKQKSHSIPIVIPVG